MSLINVYILHKCVCNHIRGGLLPTRQVQPLHDISIQFNSLHILSVTFQTIPRHTMPLHYKSRYLFIIHSVQNTLLFFFLYILRTEYKKRHSLRSALYSERNIIIITAVIGIATVFISITVVVIVV